jgi:hypothetical protein
MLWKYHDGLCVKFTNCSFVGDTLVMYYNMRERAMKNISTHYRTIFYNKEIAWHVILSIVFFVLSTIATYFAYNYTNTTGGSVVQDIILDNIRTYDVAPIYFGGMLLLIIIPTVIFIFDPRKLPFGLEVSALFFVVRAIFMIMTHLSPQNIAYYHYIEHEHHVSSVLFSLSSGTDMFFSGHTGYPFLLSLLFWDSRPWRYFFLSFSIIMAITVLLGHLHYSIDVFAAFFIAHGVYVLSRRMFAKEFALMSA